MSDNATASSDFAIEVSDHGLGYNKPQQMGRKLWAPMWGMAIMAFPIALILGIVRSNAIASGEAESTIVALGHTTTGVMFIGFTAVFTAISFAIARILGEFRKGGGEIQGLVGSDVRTLKMPPTVKLFILGMAMAMMTLLVASIIHLVVAGQVSGPEGRSPIALRWQMEQKQCSRKNSEEPAPGNRRSSSRPSSDL